MCVPRKLLESSAAMHLVTRPAGAAVAASASIRCSMRRIVPRCRVLSLAAAIAAGASACEYGNAIRLAPTATRDSLVFVIRSVREAPTTNAIYGLSILRCGDEHPMWTIAADGTRTMPDTVVYGRPIPGFAVRQGPERLEPGCYSAVISGARPLTFDVTSAGTVKLR